MNSPAEAYQTSLALFHRITVEAARRRQDDLPGLAETLQDDTVFSVGGTTRPARGWFAAGVWRYGDRPVDELFLNADRRLSGRLVSRAEDVFATLLHESCHVWAKANSIRDTSRGGRWHNRRFAEIALTIGLAVEWDPVIGHRTPGLAPWAQADYADLLHDLEQGLVLVREPKPLAAGPNSLGQIGSQITAAPSNYAKPHAEKFVFASCQCQNAKGRAVIIRVATGSWRSGVIWCTACGAPFAESLTPPRQHSSLNSATPDRKES